MVHVEQEKVNGGIGLCAGEQRFLTERGHSCPHVEVTLEGFFVRTFLSALRFHPKNRIKLLQSVIATALLWINICNYLLECFRI